MPIIHNTFISFIQTHRGISASVMTFMKVDMGRAYYEGSFNKQKLSMNYTAMNVDDLHAFPVGTLSSIFNIAEYEIEISLDDKVVFLLEH